MGKEGIAGGGWEKKGLGEEGIGVGGWGKKALGSGGGCGKRGGMGEGEEVGGGGVRRGGGGGTEGWGRGDTGQVLPTVLRKKSLSIPIPFLKMAWVYCNPTCKQALAV